MSEPSITCPNCKSEIKLTESLAAPLVKQTEARYQRMLDEQQKKVDSEREGLRAEAERLKKSKEDLDETVHQRMAQERRMIADEEQKKARASLQEDFDKEKQAREAVQLDLAESRKKLGEAQKLELQLRNVEIGFGLGKGGAAGSERLIDFGRVNFHQQLAGFHPVPDIGVPAFHIAVGAGVDGGFLGRFYRAGQERVAAGGGCGGTGNDHYGRRGRRGRGRGIGGRRALRGEHQTKQAEASAHQAFPSATSGRRRR
jgi:hypothetical protein